MYVDIKGYEGRYQIDENGNVWSSLKNRNLKPTINKDGYYVVNLSDAMGKSRSERVHRLVALHFCDKPDGCNVVNHLDCNKLNNHYTNLEWTTVSGNTKHAYDNGLISHDDLVYRSELARIKNTYTITVYKNGNIVGVYYGKEVAAKALGIDPKTIYNCVRDNRTSRGGYYFSIEKGIPEKGVSSVA